MFSGDLEPARLLRAASTSVMGQLPPSCRTGHPLGQDIKGSFEENSGNCPAPGQLPGRRRPGAGCGDCATPETCLEHGARCALRPLLLFSTPTPCSFLLHPRRGLWPWLMDDLGRDSPRIGFGFVLGGFRRPMLSARSQPLSPLSSPKAEPQREGRTTTPPRTSCQKTWLQRVTKGRPGVRSVVPRKLGVASVSVSLSVTCTRTRSPRGRRCLPKRSFDRPSSAAALSTRTGPGISSRTPGWSGSGAGRRQL